MIDNKKAKDITSFNKFDSKEEESKSQFSTKNKLSNQNDYNTQSIYSNTERK